MNDDRLTPLHYMIAAIELAIVALAVYGLWELLT